MAGECVGRFLSVGLSVIARHCHPSLVVVVVMVVVVVVSSRIYMLR